MKKIGLGALLVLLAALIFAPTSSAAQLPLATPSLMTLAAPPACAILPLSVASTAQIGSKTQTLLITSVPTGCQGAALQVTVYGAGGIVLATAVTPTMDVGATTTVALDVKFKMTDVTSGGGIALTIGGRGINTTWLG
ncbi:MAG: hypothetical protein QOJ77_1144 [Microbacteriaceae bacterium]|jgi:hypothetical protein|nr:hypothetical protein [Microbacteriaceae bacterium]